MATTKVSVKMGEWVNIAKGHKNFQIRHITGKGEVVYTEQEKKPIFKFPNPDAPAPSFSTTMSENAYFFKVKTVDNVYAWALTDDCELSITPAEE